MNTAQAMPRSEPVELELFAEPEMPKLVASMISMTRNTSTTGTPSTMGTVVSVIRECTLPGHLHVTHRARRRGASEGELKILRTALNHASVRPPQRRPLELGLTTQSWLLMSFGLSPTVKAFSQSTMFPQAMSCVVNKPRPRPSVWRTSVRLR